MEVQCIALASFVHGSINAREGYPLKMPESTAKDLERAGLVRIRLKAEMGKGVDDGKGRPSSASQPAQALTTKTLHLPKSGSPKILKPARS